MMKLPELVLVTLMLTFKKYMKITSHLLTLCILLDLVYKIKSDLKTGST